MSYQALYRKYRPTSLNDVIGQDIVVKIIKNAIQNNMIGHAYMFSGPRGIGKTSIAKLVAKVVNCENPKDGDACGKCKNCKTVNDGYCSDIIEIDAASNNGVDEIREIKNKINLVPTQLKYKVYIIDEVHMLSIGAFNALLKTLEEPPEHIIFILATTDLHKVPSTIISRCQCFEFHRISDSHIVERLEFICKKENITVEKNVLSEIARLSEGGLRDAIGMLDKLNAYSNSNITMLDFQKVNGIVSKDEQLQFLNYIYNKDIKNVIEFIDKIYDNGKDLIIFTQDMLYLTKNLSISYYIENDNSYDIEFLLNIANLFNEILKRTESSTNIKIIFEINILSFMNIISTEKEPKTELKKEESKNQVNITSEKSEIISREIILENNHSQEENKQIINNCFARASKQEKKLLENGWSQLNDYALDSEYGAVACFISDGMIRAAGEGEIILSFQYESMINRGFGLLNKIQELFEKIYHKHYDIALITNEEWQVQKQEFIDNKNKNIKYEYSPIIKVKKEEKKKKTDNSITSEAIELFGQDIISIN